MPKVILIIGTLDTKEDEVVFLKWEIEKRGHEALVIDAGVLKAPEITPEVTREEVALAGGESLDELLQSGDKGKCIENMVKGTARTVRRLFEEKKFDAVIGIGGAQGAAIGTAAMRSLPFGVPKLMVTTVASGQACFGDFVGASDLTMMHSVVDMFGVNRLSARVLSNAAAAIVGMAETTEETGVAESEIPAVAMTVLGNTTPVAMKVKSLLVERGYEVTGFHANGTGGIAMESLIGEGYFNAVLDLSTHEIMDREYGGLHAAIGENRLEEAGKAGIPLVVVPGCVDYLVMGPLDSLPADIKRRPCVVHNPQLTLVRANSEEMKHVAKLMAEKLNRSKGPVAVAIPLRGLSMHNIDGDGFFDPETDKAFRDVLKENLRSDIPVHEVDAHINDSGFAGSLVEVLTSLHSG